MNFVLDETFGSRAHYSSADFDGLGIPNFTILTSTLKRGMNVANAFGRLKKLARVCMVSAFCGMTHNMVLY